MAEAFNPKACRVEDYKALFFGHLNLNRFGAPGTSRGDPGACQAWQAWQGLEVYSSKNLHKPCQSFIPIKDLQGDLLGLCSFCLVKPKEVAGLCNTRTPLKQNALAARALRALDEKRLVALVWKYHISSHGFQQTLITLPSSLA